MQNLFYRIVIIGVFITLGLGTSLAAEESTKELPSAVTVSDPNIPADQLVLKLGPLTADELFVEADAWLKLLQNAATEVYDKKLIIKQMNDKIDKDVEKNISSSVLDNETAVKDHLIEKLTDLRKIRKNKEDNLNAVLLEINERIGLDDKGHELDKVRPYRLYLKSVSGTSEEITSVKSFMKGISTWIFSEDGGILWLIDILKFFSILLVAWFVARILSNGVKRAFELSKNSSQLLQNFMVNLVNKLVMFLGLLMALAVLGVNMGPVLAFVGAAGFVVAFALQNTLSNFASGLMIMLYRPFDIDDVIDVSGVIGTVKSMTLVTTSIMTADNRMMIVPNNTIWGSIITNVTHSDKRRVDMTFGIGYTDNIDKAQKVLEDVLAKHPLILKDPKPTVQVHELADSSVNFIVRPWTLTSDYWTVYWEITRRVKIRFDEENISIPFPQRDIHIVTSAEDSEVPRKKEFTKKHAKEIDVSEMESGEEDDD